MYPTISSERVFKSYSSTMHTKRRRNRRAKTESGRNAKLTEFMDSNDDKAAIDFWLQQPEIDFRSDKAWEVLRSHLNVTRKKTVKKNYIQTRWIDRIDPKLNQTCGTACLQREDLGWRSNLQLDEKLEILGKRMDMVRAARMQRLGAVVLLGEEMLKSLMKFEDKTTVVYPVKIFDYGNTKTIHIENTESSTTDTDQAKYKNERTESDNIRSLDKKRNVGQDVEITNKCECCERPKKVLKHESYIDKSNHGAITADKVDAQLPDKDAFSCPEPTCVYQNAEEDSGSTSCQNMVLGEDSVSDLEKIIGILCHPKKHDVMFQGRLSVNTDGREHKASCKVLADMSPCTFNDDGIPTTSAVVPSNSNINASSGINGNQNTVTKIGSTMCETMEITCNEHACESEELMSMEPDPKMQNVMFQEALRCRNINTEGGTTLYSCTISAELSDATTYDVERYLITNSTKDENSTNGISQASCLQQITQQTSDELVSDEPERKTCDVSDLNIFNRFDDATYGKTYLESCQASADTYLFHKSDLNMKSGSNICEAFGLPETSPSVRGLTGCTPLMTNYPMLGDSKKIDIQLDERKTPTDGSITRKCTKERKSYAKIEPHVLARMYAIAFQNAPDTFIQREQYIEPIEKETVRNYIRKPREFLKSRFQEVKEEFNLHDFMFDNLWLNVAESSQRPR